MKLLRQFLIILAISFVGEALKYLLPLPVPASIYGMVILFVGLLTGLIKLSWVKDAGKFLIAVMPVMFIPAGVGLMASWGVLKPMLVPVLVAAAGVAKMVDKSFVADGAVVIDVGINVDEDGNLCGDVDFEDVAENASVCTPVPGGVGSVTTSVLAKHLLKAAKARRA